MAKLKTAEEMRAVSSVEVAKIDIDAEVGAILADCEIVAAAGKTECRGPEMSPKDISTQSIIDKLNELGYKAWIQHTSEGLFLHVAW